MLERVDLAQMIDGVCDAFGLGAGIAKHRAGPFNGRRQLLRTAKRAADRNTQRSDDPGCDGTRGNVERERQRADRVDHCFDCLDAGRDDRIALFDPGTHRVGGSHGGIAGDLGGCPHAQRPRRC